MRAVVISSFGGPEVLRIEQVPVTDPGPGQVRIQVQAASVNPADLAARAGVFGAMLPSGQYVLGWDAAGVVDAVGAQVSGFAVGDRVAGVSIWFREFVGTQAEYVVLPASSIAAIPAGLSTVEAATIPLNGLTAIQALDLAGLRPGQTLAVTGAAGAVGGYAVQLAARRGWRVVAVAGAEDEQLVRGLGASTFVVRSTDPSAAIRAVEPLGVHAVLDTANLSAAVIGAVRDHGAHVAVTTPAQPPPQRGIRVALVLVRPDGAALAELLGLAANGDLTTRVAATYPLTQVAQAHERLAQGGVRGRLVLVP